MSPKCAVLVLVLVCYLGNSYGQFRYSPFFGIEEPPMTDDPIRGSQFGAFNLFNRNGMNGMNGMNRNSGFNGYNGIMSRHSFFMNRNNPFFNGLSFGGANFDY